jgi:glutamate-1-semialdehyde 2,1-aminomutase
MHHKSAAAFRRAGEYMPGGVNSPVRAFRGVDLQPLFIARARGARIFDIDGQEYLDYVGSWGPMILGHAHPQVVAAIHEAVERGTSFGAPTEGETELAARIIQAFPSIDRLRLLSSGTEAVMTALRLARAYTRRDLIVKMAGCYHGHSDSMLVQAGSGVAEAEDMGPKEPRGPRLPHIAQGVPASPGVPAALASLTLVVPYNDIHAVQRVIAEHPGQIAAVIVEPVAANMGVVPPVPGYLEGLRRLCDEDDALLILDEVITGFRVALGGAQERFGIEADLTCLGKIVGGGLPLAACGGRADIMDLLAPVGPVYQAGTLSGNPIATAAGNATLALLGDSEAVGAEGPATLAHPTEPAGPVSSHARPVYRRLETSAARLEAGLAQAAADAGIPMRTHRVGSLLSCFFTDRHVANFEDVRTTDIATFKRFFAEMLSRGVYLAPSAYEAIFVSAAHTEQDIERTIATARESFTRIAETR